MALTSAQCVDARRYMGYSLSGNATAEPYRELVYSNSTIGSISLDYRLANLSSDEESVVINSFLTPLNARETEIQGAAANLDTDEAAVWKHNKSEVSDRVQLYNYLRRELCRFLGFAPGPLLQGGNRAVRC